MSAKQATEYCPESNVPVDQCVGCRKEHMPKHVHLELPPEMLARIDEARKTPAGEIKRNEWIRRAIEQALSRTDLAVDEGAKRLSTNRVRVPASAAAPAERPDTRLRADERIPKGAAVMVGPEGGVVAAQSYRQSVPGPNVENVRSSAQAKKDVKPLPKGKR